MLNNRIKLNFHRVGRRTKNNNTKTEETKESSAICKEEYLTNRNLSIITDKNLEPDVVDNVCLRSRQKQRINARASNSSSTNSEDYVMIVSEEMPSVLKDKNWEHVDYRDISESIRGNSTVKKYCSPRCSSAWFLKIRREILKSCSNKIFPVLTNG